MDRRSAEELVKQLSWKIDNAHLRFTVVTVLDGALKGQVVIQGIPRVGSLLLDLPLELRDRIYSYVFARQTDITIKSYAGRNGVKLVSGSDFRTPSCHPGQKWNRLQGKWNGGPPSEFSVLLANKQIHAEATPVAYRLQAFKFRSHPSVRVPHFVELVGTSVRHLGVVKLENTNIQGFKAILQALKGATGLHKLHIPAHDFVFEHIKYKAKNFDDPVSWACAFNKLISNFLLDLQKAYKASNRSWKAVDVVQIERTWYTDRSSMRYRYSKKMLSELDLFEAAFKEITAGYLEA